MQSRGKLVLRHPDPIMVFRLSIPLKCNLMVGTGRVRLHLFTATRGSSGVGVSLSHSLWVIDPTRWNHSTLYAHFRTCTDPCSDPCHHILGPRRERKREPRTLCCVSVSSMTSVDSTREYHVEVRAPCQIPLPILFRIVSIGFMKIQSLKTLCLFVEGEYGWGGGGLAIREIFLLWFRSHCGWVGSTRDEWIFTSYASVLFRSRLSPYPVLLFHPSAHHSTFNESRSSRTNENA